MSRTLDSDGQVSMALRAVARFLTCLDSTTVGDEAADARNIFVVDSRLFAETLSASATAATERWAAATGLWGSGGCHFSPRGKDSGATKRLARFTPKETATRAVPPRLLMGCLQQESGFQMHQVLLSKIGLLVEHPLLKDLHLANPRR